MERFTGSFTQQEPIPAEGIEAALRVLHSGRLHRYNTAPGEVAEAALLEEDFAVREFVPVVQRIEAIDAISVPSVWTVMTDKGRTTLTLRAEEDIRKLKDQHQLLIASRDGVQYLIPDARQLDRQSHKFLELFL